MVYKVRTGRADLVEKRVKLLPLRDVLPKCNLVAIAKAALIHLEVARNAGVTVICVPP